MTNKEKYIKAMEKTIEKHRNPYGKVFISFANCALCKVTSNGKKSALSTCIKCPYYTGNISSPGCNIVYDYYKDGLGYPIYSIIPSVVPLLEYHLDLIKQAPASQFTVKGWKPFNLPKDIPDKLKDKYK